MNMSSPHLFYIPVMGTGFTIDTPIYVAKYGIDSVISLVDDILIEKMRKYYCHKYNKHYTPITNTDSDPRANRITAYLNLINDIVKAQIVELKNNTFDANSDLSKYFEMLHDNSSLKKCYNKMKETTDSNVKIQLQNYLINKVKAGSIDVNIMTKLDRVYYRNDVKLASEYSDALSALRGYAKSNLCSSIVFSAGLNKKLYNYIEKFDNFYPTIYGKIQKKVIIKVNDYRSALIQGKYLAKKGLWVSEFRIESGLNCGGHLFSKKGKLLGPVLDEFKGKKNELIDTLHQTLNKSLTNIGKKCIDKPLPLKLTVQGGIASSKETAFLIDYYKVDAVGWGTPFLLVPEATSVDNGTLKKLMEAKEKDIHISNVSPLNVLFHNLCNSDSEKAKKARILNGDPGSLCPKGYLTFNTEFSNQPICIASKKYQQKKIQQLKAKNLPESDLLKQIKNVTDKSCICNELGGSVLIKHKITQEKKINPAICPGPNIAYFSKTFSLSEMIEHIYGKTDLLKNINRPNMFVTELKLNIDLLKQKIAEYMHSITTKELPDLNTFYKNLKYGINYYKNMICNLIDENRQYKEKMKKDLTILNERLDILIQEIKLPASCN